MCHSILTVYKLHCRRVNIYNSFILHRLQFDLTVIMHRRLFGRRSRWWLHGGGVLGRRLLGGRVDGEQQVKRFDFGISLWNPEVI